MTHRRSILVGVDFSKCSASAVNHAARIARDGGVELHAVHVLEPLVVTNLQERLGYTLEEIVASQLRDARAAWAGFASQAAETLTAELSVEIGNPGIVLLREARALPAELVVVGARGSSPVATGIGVVAATCLKKAPCDVLLVRDRHRAAFKRVAACVGFSEVSPFVVDRAARIAVQNGAELHVMHAFDGPWNKLHYRAPTPEAKPDFQRQYRDALRRRLQVLAEPLIGEITGLQPQYQLFDHASPCAAIAQFVKDMNVDLVAIGASRCAHLRDVFVGTITERVANLAPVSILTVRPPVQQ
jgi:nucleotide-binding universal stress UspA family protein